MAASIAGWLAEVLEPWLATECGAEQVLQAKHSSSINLAPQAETPATSGPFRPSPLCQQQRLWQNPLPPLHNAATQERMFSPQGTPACPHTCQSTALLQKPCACALPLHRAQSAQAAGPPGLACLGWLWPFSMAGLSPPAASGQGSAPAARQCAPSLVHQCRGSREAEGGQNGVRSHKRGQIKARKRALVEAVVPPVPFLKLISLLRPTQTCNSRITK